MPDNIEKPLKPGSKKFIKIIKKMARNRPLQEAALTGTLCLVATMVSILFLFERSINVLNAEIREGLARSAAIAATTLDGDTHKKFRSKAWKKDPEYIAYLEKMEKIRLASENVRYIYTNIEKDGKIFFIVNPSPQNDVNGNGHPPEAPQLMDPYPDAGEALIQAIKTRKVTVDELPYTDRWGTFYSAYAPFFDKKGNFEAVLGIDLEVDNYNEHVGIVKHATAIAGGVGGILSLLCSLLVYRFRKNQAKYVEALAESNRIIKNELDEAEKYVQSLFPPPLKGSIPPQSHDTPVVLDWIYQSSTELGGDTFGYHWIDDDHFAAYLIDVCGHGVGPALHSVTVLSSIKNMSLHNTDFLNPSAVLSSLNHTFPMDRYNQIYFTVWYGVFNRKTGILEYASGGHPPAVLMNGDNENSAKQGKLLARGSMVGCFDNSIFVSGSVKLKKYNRLYVFSDGTYEINYAEKSRIMSLDEFSNELAKPAGKDSRKVEEVKKFSQNAQGREHFDDDFTLMEMSFFVEDPDSNKKSA